MAPERVKITWLVFVAACLTLCQGQKAFGHKKPNIFKRSPDPASAPAPAAAPAAAPAGAPAAAAKKCEKPLDVVFVLDSSEKIGKDNWEKIVNATIDIASTFDLKFARFGVVQYQSYPEAVIKLMKFNDDKSLAATLRKIFYKNGGKRTDLALNATLEVFKSASVRSGSKVVILITGGPSADVYIDAAKPPITGADLLKLPTDQLHSSEIAVYAVGIQDGLSSDDKKTFTSQLNLIASEPTADHVFEVADYAKLADTATTVANKSCVVNGGWSTWSAWSQCNHPCMVKLRTRECNNPAPESGGLNCTGPKVEQFPCGSAMECQTSPKPVPPQESGIVIHGQPDPKQCGNGLEILKLLDSQYDASTSYAEGPNEAVKTQSKIDHMPSMGQVNSTKGRGAWCADHAKAAAKDKNQYLQLDLGGLFLIGMVEIQGQYYYPNFITKFSLSYSSDGVTWSDYVDNSGNKVLSGNNDQNTRVDNYLSSAITTRFIRFKPVESATDDMCMRVAVFKCRPANLVPPKKDQPEDAWADKWANAARKSKIEKSIKFKSHAKVSHHEKH